MVFFLDFVYYVKDKTLEHLKIGSSIFLITRWWEVVLKFCFLLAFSSIPKRVPGWSRYTNEVNVGLPWWFSGKEPLQCRRRERCWFSPWVGKMLWRRK